MPGEGRGWRGEGGGLSCALLQMMMRCSTSLFAVSFSSAVPMVTCTGLGLGIGLGLGQGLGLGLGLGSRLGLGFGFGGSGHLHRVALEVARHLPHLVRLGLGVRDKAGVREKVLKMRSG